MQGETTKEKFIASVLKSFETINLPCAVQYGRRGKSKCDTDVGGISLLFQTNVQNILSTSSFYLPTLWSLWFQRISFSLFSVLFCSVYVFSHFCCCCYCQFWLRFKFMGNVWVRANVIENCFVFMLRIRR